MMFKKPMLINSGLLIILGMLSYNLSQMWLSFYNPSGFDELAKKPEITIPSADKNNTGEPRRDSLKMYNVIGEKNVFLPQRQEWTPPPVVAAPSKPGPVPDKEPEPPPPPTPLPNPTLMGIIMEEDGEKIAIMQGHHREEVEARATTPSRFSRRIAPRAIPDRIVADRIKNYHEGDTISEAVIVEIHEDKVILDRDGERIEILIGNKSGQSAPAPPAIPTHRRFIPASSPSPYIRPPVPANESAEGEDTSSALQKSRSRLELLEKSRAARKEFLRRQRLGTTPSEE
jgi:hypothetical protein